MSAVRLAYRLTSKAASVRRSNPAVPANASLRRNFRSTACRKEQFLDVDQTTFERTVSKENSEGKVVLVDFYADWCGPCRTLSPILMKITAPENAQNVKTGSGRAVDLLTVNTDQQGDLAATYGVSALPTVIAFKDGKPVQKFMGALPEKSVKDFIASL